jgi:hypothetical protein
VRFGGNWRLETSLDPIATYTQCVKNLMQFDWKEFGSGPTTLNPARGLGMQHNPEVFTRKSKFFVNPRLNAQGNVSTDESFRIIEQ